MKFIKYLLLPLSICLLLRCQKDQKVEDELFVFQADERLFAADAFMNIGGFDLEYNDQGMHPIRAEVRKELMNRLDKEYQHSIREYYSNHDQYLGYYGTYALLLTKPPNFSLNYDPQKSDEHISDIVNALPELDEHLSEFYQRANIHKLWERYKIPIQEKIDSYRPYAKQAIDDLMAYFKTDKKAFKQSQRKLVTLFSPLMSYFTAFTVTINNDFYFVFGPEPGEPSAGSYYHEVMHHIANPIVEKHLSEVNQLFPLSMLAKEKLPNSDWNYVVIESFVRTISKVLEGRLHKFADEKIRETIEDEYKLGYVLCFYFYENLPAYEVSNEPMEQYFSKLITNVDVEKEKTRWKEFWNNQSN
ncbi:MAG: hypothetical protein ONB05_08935 [candidate division KSB1 bacterium]|nr:hypothetical protein [candidate division KSB1 bacterium]